MMPSLTLVVMILTTANGHELTAGRHDAASPPERTAARENAASQPELASVRHDTASNCSCFGLFVSASKEVLEISRF